MKKVFKTIGYILSVPFVGLAMLMGLLFARRKAKKYKKDPNSVFLADRLKTVNKMFSRFMYLKRVEVIAQDIDKLPTKQMLFIANHKSILDPMVVFKVLYENGKMGHISFICKYELSQHWYTRCIIELMDGIFIKRDDGRSIYQCYLKETENLKKGFSVVVFPEGTRVPGDEFVKEFNPTTLKVAYQNFVSITPMTIYGADKKRKFWETKKITVFAHKPVQPNNFINIQIEQLMETLKGNIIDKYIELKLLSQEKSK